MTGAEIRLELLRIASAAAGRDDKLALDIAKAWEPWVMDGADSPPGEAADAKAAKPNVV